MNRLIDFFNDEDNRSSMTRLLMFFMCGAYIVWASYVTFATKVIPDLPIALGAFLGSLYGINKVGPNISIGNNKGA